LSQTLPERLIEQMTPSAAGIVHRCIGCRDRNDAAARPACPSPDRHHQSVGDQLRRHGCTHRPADHAPREQIDDRRYIKPALGCPDIGSLIDYLRSVSLSRISATCKVLFEVIPSGASSRHPRRRNPECEVRDALLACTSIGFFRLLGLSAA
jgi:hypothetical protein